jgi:hypothetical protein
MATGTEQMVSPASPATRTTAPRCPCSRSQSAQLAAVAIAFVRSIVPKRWSTAPSSVRWSTRFDVFVASPGYGAPETVTLRLVPVLASLPVRSTASPWSGVAQHRMGTLVLPVIGTWIVRFTLTFDAGVFGWNAVEKPASYPSH